MASVRSAPASAAQARPRALSRLLFLVAMLVFAMVVVGGITRLTESGLSITEWKPISGAIPPLSHADWARAFGLYQTTPEYQQINGPAGMTLAQFKHIYWWEFIHRLLGRLIGVIFAAGLAWLAWKRAIPKGYGWKMAGLLALGGAQGLLGWYMVISGLSQRTDVSHFRLSAHLLLALAIMGALIWVALDLRRLAAIGEDRPSRLTTPAAVTIAILFVQLMLGAWVAGLNAGHVASDWPLMQGRLFPDGVDWSQGAFWALTNDPYLIHFLHRWWAWVVVAAMIIFARKVRNTPGARNASIVIHAAFGTQVLLGIATVLSGVAIWLAALHQAVGALLVAATIWGANESGTEEMSVVSIYTVFANAEEAERIGRAAVEERLAACVNIVSPVHSIYRWQGAVETADEVAAIFKTADHRVDALMTRIASLHSYDVPCIVTWPVDKLSGSYADWVEASVD